MGPSWAVSGPSWAVLGFCWGLRGRLRGLWGPSWAVRWLSKAAWGSSWAVLGLLGPRGREWAVSPPRGSGSAVERGGSRIERGGSTPRGGGSGVERAVLGCPGALLGRFGSSDRRGAARGWVRPERAGPPSRLQNPCHTALGALLCFNVPEGTVADLEAIMEAIFAFRGPSCHHIGPFWTLQQPTGRTYRGPTREAGGYEAGGAME